MNMHNQWRSFSILEVARFLFVVQVVQTVPVVTINLDQPLVMMQL